jgi:hypothetical protein
MKLEYARLYKLSGTKLHTVLMVRLKQHEETTNVLLRIAFDENLIGV